MNNTTDERAREQAQSQIQGIRDMIAELNAAREANDDEAIEAAEWAIHEDPLSVEVRSGWHSPGEDGEAEEFCILLCTGGPAVRIIGDLGRYNEPESARVQYQDWFTPWGDAVLTEEESADVLAYARTFYFGE